MHPDLNGYWQFFGRIDVGEGWFFHAPVPADTTRDNFDFHGLLHEVAGFRFACEFDHVGFWDLRVAVAEQYQVGRVFIAGDAAHSHPPYGGFGLNNGLEDAVNLGWKFAARLQGWGGDALLRSYSEERRPIFQETAEDFIAARIRNDGAFLARYSPAARREGIRARRGRHARATSEPGRRLRAELRGLAGGDRPAGRRVQRARQARVQGASRASPARRSRCRRGATCSRSWGPASRCWRSTPTMQAVERVRAGARLR